ncbi:MAG: hypothetical protein IJ731_03875 [Eubacterium sp.]|nr:hypothetical protein [Eubacterium sp.]
MKQEQLRKLYDIFYESATTQYLPNKKEQKEAADKFYDFIEEVQSNPDLLGDDDSTLNLYLKDYLDEYAFAAFGIGFALGKSIETETDAFTPHIKAIKTDY